MSLRVRFATRSDEPAIQHVIRTVFEEHSFTWEPKRYHADLFDLNRFYFDEGDLFYVAEMERTVVGTVAYEEFPAIPGEPGQVVWYDGYRRVGAADCSLERLYVLPEARGRGIGSRLIEAVVCEAKRRGRLRMELWSDKRFQDAHRQYVKFGAVVVGDRICDDPDESPEWGLVIDLASITLGNQ